ncbi:hypothetical protein HZI73_04665 [Vallitalea pronyensis]|uniref:Uncharacterized protein n=1 Tax=Vallitalea pronyensis TaxID=1348613 RepID=A0A8J8SFV3_9FIRM|nr:hypothetical protein [Vallitalea pronyensis]QUI21628.1 hypothetical protein HZI73_04665 [Vallitalea pronyensis]
MEEEEDALVLMVKPFLGQDLSADNWRQWIYAVKTLELLKFKFYEEDLPSNYIQLVKNINKNRYMKISSSHNAILNAIIIGGLLTISSCNNEIDHFKKILLDMNSVSHDDDFFLKKRSYATLALHKMGMDELEINQTLKMASGLQLSGGYKAYYKAKIVTCNQLFKYVCLQLINKY